MRQPDETMKLVKIALIFSTILVIMAGAIWAVRFFMAQRSQASAPAQLTLANQAIPGFPMPGHLAPDFKLTDQFGQTVSLSSLRGHEIVLAFIDSRCTSLCPLTAEIMYDAKAKLSPSAASQVELVAINANPTATSIAIVQAWSINHGMLHQWLFLTGTAQQLEAVYHAYGVYVQVSSKGTDVHDPATYIIDATGHERLYYETLASNLQTDLGDEEAGMEAGMQQWLPK